MRGFRGILIPLVLVVSSADGGPLRADLIRLKSGGEVRGELIGAPRPSDDEVSIRTLTGATVTVNREDVEFFTRRPLKIEDYESRARRTEQTVEAQWELADWCRLNGLASQREECLERIIELDPDHQAAHQGLGHARRDGVWMSREEDMTARGYVKYKNRYVTPQELEVIEEAEENAAVEKGWFKKVRLWHAALGSGQPQRARTALVELQQIHKPEAVPALTRFLADDPNQPVRELYVSILKQIGGPRPVLALVKQSLFDVSHEVRYAALNAISAEQYAAAMPLYIRELKNELNEIVLRAGIALQRIGDEQAVPALIDALVTSHRYKVTVADTSGTLSFGTIGTFGNSGSALPPDVEAALRTGQLPNGVIVDNSGLNQLKRPKVVTVTQTHQNQAVLEALQKLTGESFGYDERTWRLWLTAKKNGAVQ